MTTPNTNAAGVAATDMEPLTSTEGLLLTIRDDMRWIISPMVQSASARAVLEVRTVRAEIRRLRAQRDELAGALQGFVHACNNESMFVDPDSSFTKNFLPDGGLDRARAALSTLDTQGGGK